VRRPAALPALVVSLALSSALSLASGAPALAQPSMVAEDPYPLRGEPTRVRVEGSDGSPLAGVPLRARYRPNSETAHTAELGETGADGAVGWTPTDAGVVLLEAGSAEAPSAQTRVSVRFGAFPSLGLLVMVVAALILFGGAALGFYWLMSGPEPLPAEEPPST
jgi:hypothetical protein